MASHKSHFSSLALQDGHSLSAQRNTSRLPTRSVTPTSAHSHIPFPSATKLTKRRLSRDHKPGRPEVATSAQKVVSSSNPEGQGSSARATRLTFQGLINPSAARALPQPPSARGYRLEVPQNPRTPSLVSGSSASTIESSPRSVLRRKPSSIGKQVSRNRAGSMSSQDDAQTAKTLPGGYSDPFDGTVLGITLPPSSAPLTRKEIILEMQETQIQDARSTPILATNNLPPPAPQYAMSASPSTRYSESPGPFSVASTPTSMSSHSPAAALASKAAPKMRQASPSLSRPPVARRKTDEPSSLREARALSSVRESTISSSSASTVKSPEGALQKDTALPSLPNHPLSPNQNPTAAPIAVPLSSEPSQMPPKPSLETSRSPQIQVPPQLAALGEAPSQPKPSSRIPPRPSRSGTSDLLSAREPSPIIQSNLSSLPASHHRRQSSVESRSGVMPGPKTRLVMPSKVPSRNPSPNPSLASTFSPPSRPATARGPTPDAHVDTERKQKKGITAPSPSPSKLTSRFGFFTRKKSEPGQIAQKPEKKLRKGPMAGTGHEGYGKYAMRGRSGSTTSGGSMGRSASAGSTPGSVIRTPSSRKSSIGSQGEDVLDEFFLDRLNPVVIRGEGPSTETSTRQSSESSIVKRPSLDRGKPTLLPSAMSDDVRAVSPSKRIPIGSRRSSDESGNFITNLAARRSFRRSGYLERIPTPINTTAAATAPIVETTSYSIPETGGTMPQTEDDTVTENRFVSKLKSKKAPPKEKSARKWNFFQRATQASPKRNTTAVLPSGFPTAPPSRSVAHYAMLDAEDRLDMEEIEKLMQEPDEEPRDFFLDVQHTFDVEEPKDKQEHPQSILLPSPPSFPAEFAQAPRPMSPKVALRKPEPAEAYSTSQPAPAQASLPQVVSPVSSPPAPPPATDSPSHPKPRPSRLPQVGRIPKVVSRRDQDRQLPVDSFSRPFVPTMPRPAMQSTPNLLAPEAALGAFTELPPVTQPPLAPLPASPPNISNEPESIMISATADSNTAAHPSISSPSEFLSFPPRKDSEVSYSSSSGVWSYTPSTAIIPAPGSPPTEDEVWKEYDDLIDDVLSPLNRGNAARSNSSYFPAFKVQEGKDDSKDTTQGLTSMRVSVGRANAAFQPGPPSNSTSSPFHLRRSRLLAILNPTYSQSTTISLSDFVNGYGERNLSVIDPNTGRLSFPSTVRYSTNTDSSCQSSARSSLPASMHITVGNGKASGAEDATPPRNHYRDTRLMELAENQTEGAVTMANLRFSALMTSKWLSFGRVLFSPAHFELKNREEDRVLILDGLGKDWSYYVALTYPDASVYNLGPDNAPVGSASSTGLPSTLPNHRHIYHPHLSAPFPFPKGFFAAVVFRFPVATSEATLRQCVFECKRVLRPGGYLEISVLDFDMCNMGNRARRAVRGLKLKMSVADPTTSLKPISDNLQKLVGRRGFENLNRCFVGVPAAGSMSTGSSSCSEDEGASIAKGKEKAKEQQEWEQKDNQAADAKPEFGEIYNRNGKDGDESITRMVARVGRWWYSRCYESAVLPEADLSQSIWSDSALIRECEKRGTTFKLLIAYAQKPVVNRRRTVSV